MQRLEAALDVEPFLSYAQKVLTAPLTSSDEYDESSDEDSTNNTDSSSGGGAGSIRNFRKLAYGVKASKQGRFY